MRLVRLLLLILSISILPSIALADFGPLRVASVSNTKIPGNAASGKCSLSVDGRFVTFSSVATNLVVGVTNGKSQIYLRDRLQQRSELVSISALAGTPAGDGDSFSASITGDGGSVAFDSNSSNLVAGDTNGVRDVFVRVRGTATTLRVSQSINGGACTHDCRYPSISNDGRYVAYLADNDFGADVLVVDRTTSAVTRVNRAATAPFVPNDSNSAAGLPAITSDGNYVVYGSFASNLVSGSGAENTDTNGRADVFIFDRNLLKNERVSIPPNGVSFSDSIANDASVMPLALGPGSVSNDGRFVAFAVDMSGSGPERVYIRDRVAKTTVEVSAGVTPGAGATFNDFLQVSGDGSSAVFLSEALDASYNVQASRVYRFDRVLNQLVVINSSAAPWRPVCLSADGGSIGMEKDTVTQIYITDTDQCLQDSNKERPGVCGCGVADIDANNDGTMDCLTGAPAAPTALRVIP